MTHLLNFLNSVNKGSEAENIAAIRSILYKNYIKTVFEQVDESDPGFRVIFIGNRFKSDFTNPLTADCNGAICWYSRADKKFTPLVIPTKLFNANNTSKKEISKRYEAGVYNVYPVLDGTIVNLYYFNGHWCLSTMKAYDATNLTMINGKTYSYLFEESGGIVPEDTSKCYTMCVKNKAFHVFDAHNSVVPIQEVNLATKQVTYLQEPLEQVKWRVLNNALYTAITDYRKSKQVFYGVILRSKNQTDQYDNVLLESNLMVKVRNFLYNFEFVKKFPEVDYIAASKLNIFLCRKNVNLFLGLFPEYSQEFREYNSIVNKIARYITRKGEANAEIANAGDAVLQDLKSKKVNLPRESIADYIQQQKFFEVIYPCVY